MAVTIRAPSSTARASHGRGSSLTFGKTMTILAFLLDEDPQNPVALIAGRALIVPLAAVACWLLAVKNRRLVSYAVGVASLSALIQVLPLWRHLVKDYYDYYTEEKLKSLGLLALPFVTTAIAYCWARARPNQPPEPTR